MNNEMEGTHETRSLAAHYPRRFARPFDDIFVPKRREIRIDLRANIEAHDNCAGSTRAFHHWTTPFCFSASRRKDDGVRYSVPLREFLRE